MRLFRLAEMLLIAGERVGDDLFRGCGILESEIPHIFDRFYRAQGSSRADGTGLGLALAHEITDHLGGDIQVHSRPEAGSIFSVLLPLTADPPGKNGSRSP